jgi:BirA family biotin operon repressor/biotin-[acetyl-CoA-carboxylase] ligase
MDLTKLNILKQKNLLEEIVYLKEIHSTNLYAKETNPANDTLIIASHQYKGRGRFDRVWETDEGKDITITLVKSFKLPSSDVHLVNFYTSLIICNVLNNILSDRQRFFVALKWPNDILLNGKKISGILTELLDLNTVEKKFIIGIGVNVNNEQFSEKVFKKATSLKISTGVNFNIPDIIVKIVKEFYENLNLLKNKQNLLNLWKTNTDLIDKEILFTENISKMPLRGIIKDIQDDGGIKIDINNESKTKKIAVYYSGEINFI